MENHLIGMTCAISAAFVWAFAVVLFKKSGEQVAPLSLNLFKNVVAMLLLTLTLLFMGDGFSIFHSFPAQDFWILTVSGILGIAVADTLFFYSLNLIGVGLCAIAECLYSPFIFLFAWILLAESLVPLQYIGAALVITAVLITARHKPPQDRTRFQLGLGILLSALAMAFMGFGIVMAKPVLQRFPMIWATQIRLAGGTAALALCMLLLPRRRALFSALLPSKSWLTSIPGAVLGSYLALILWIAGFKYTQTSTAAILNQTNTIFALILASLLLKEPFTRRKTIATCTAMIGIFLVIYFKHET